MINHPSTVKWLLFVLGVFFHLYCVLYLGLGETDEFAHQGEYDTYLQKIHQADAMIAELWYQVQTDPFYKNNTTFIITTDHGRGGKTNNWSSHGFWIKGSGQTWFAMIGKGIAPGGEIKQPQQVYQKQLAATIASLLGVTFKAKHTISPPLLIESTTTKNDSIQLSGVTDKNQITAGSF